MATPTYNMTHYFPLAPSIWGQATTISGTLAYASASWGAAKYGTPNTFFTSDSAPTTPMYVDEVY